MKLYEVVIVKSALKQLDTIPVTYREKIMARIDALRMNPRPHGC